MNLFILKTWLQAKFTTDERGASMVEYGLLLALIAVVAIVAVKALGGSVSSKFNDVNSNLTTPTT
jgi:pilus assembly protein Flp/PilA